MDVKQFKEEVLKRYPIGCKVISIYDNTPYIFTNNITFDKWVKESGIYWGSNVRLYNETTNKWAEIIEYPKDYVKPNLEINDYLLY